MLKISDAIAALRDAEHIAVSAAIAADAKPGIIRALARPLKLGAHTPHPTEIAAIEAAILSLIPTEEAMPDVRSDAPKPARKKAKPQA